MTALPLGYHNMDCMELLKQLPDKSVDLAITDPPYGDGGGYLEEARRFKVRRTVRPLQDGTGGGRFDRYKTHVSNEQEDNGRVSTAKKS